MGWRARKIAKLVTKYQAAICVTSISDLAVVNVPVYQNKPQTFVIAPVKQVGETCIFSTRSYEARVAEFAYQCVGVQVGFSPIAKSPGFSFDDSLEVTVVSFNEFFLNIRRFSFQRVRREREPLLPKIEEGVRVHRGVKAVKLPPPPPRLRKVDLEERLRWILTPPINELLSDPQLALPARPFPFQTVGIKWLFDRDCALLADEMGLGKTMQAIIAARLLWRSRAINQVLVICPKTLIATWQVEIRKWWPQVGPNVMVAGSDRQFFLRLGTPNVIIKIINYASIVREADWLEQQEFSHDLVIIDEAQKIKNPKAKTSRAVKALEADRRWAMTGTPLENKVDDLISIFDFVEPMLFKDDKEGWFTEPASTCFTGRPAIQEMIAPYLLRRRAEEVLDELPEKSEQDVEIELTPAQRELYDRIEEDGVVELNEKGDSITVTHVFALINRLRQFCNFEPNSGESAKLERLLEDLEEVSESGRKALVFSQFVQQPFGLMRLAQELRRNGHKVLELHGRIPQNRRADVIRGFESGRQVTSLLLNFTVGGVGLNLQAANYVFLFDRWWNPAVEDQAVKRVHRIGQQHKVFIKRFYCKDTIEERILKKLAEKRRLFRSIIDDARPEPDSLGLTEEEIFSLFNLKVRPRKSTEKGAPPRVVFENMDPTQFEIMVAEVYRKLGFAVRHSGGSHDAGIDVLAEKRSPGGIERLVIQCKHQKANVGRPVLQQLWGVVSADPSFTRGALVTSTHFTAEAKQFATGKRLDLIAGDSLRSLVRDLGVAQVDPPQA